ncbi:MAG: ABC transporter ATP-binding protein [Prevotella sp.]|nr:ABC transporter ATP-binding protein [Prevotella sp.]MBR7054801.1 ABC transporter ATP-binding protein [Prevotella sp.]
MNIFQKIKNYFTPEESKYTAGEILKWLWEAWKGNRLQAVINASLGLLSVVVSLSAVWAIHNAIDIASGVKPGSIYWAVGLMGLIVLCNFAINIATVWVKNILGIRARNRMQQRLLDRILRSEWHSKEKRHTGDVINRLATDVGHVINFLTETMPNSLSTLALFIGAFAYLYSMDKVLSLVIVAMVPVVIILSRIYMRKMRQLSRDVRTCDSKVQSVLTETVQNRMLIKIMESDDAMIDKLETTQSELRQMVVKRTFFSVIANFVLNFGFSLGYLIAFLWSAIRLSNHTLTFGGMTAFLQLVNRVQGPAKNLTKLVPEFVYVFTSAERLMELEDNPLEEQGHPVYVNAPCGVRLNNISFAYEEGGNVVEDLSFDFKPGSCTAILGETGAGKTTLVRMILALMFPQKGTVEIYNKKESKQLTPLMRCNFVYVPQGNTLLSGTIRDNLLLGKLDATDEEMEEALKVSCAEFVLDLPEGLDTVCSESGGGLSEGQAQRIAIARALLRDRSIMLFDEATSALDPETERNLLQNILAKHDKTVIFITHRPAVMEYCDQTLKIDKI